MTYREIKFRGKRKDNGEWVYGNLIIQSKRDYSILEDGLNLHCNKYDTLMHLLVEVDPKTIGQYTGLKDKNENEIYEGDIVKWIDNITIGHVKRKGSIFAKKEEKEMVGVIEYTKNKLNDMYCYRIITNLFTQFETFPDLSRGALHPSNQNTTVTSSLDKDLTIFLSERLEIIGTVHENPELLNNNQK